MTVTSGPLIPLRELDLDDASAVLVEAAKEGGAPVLERAVRVTLADFAGPEGPRTGRLPLPDHAAFASWLAARGIAPGTPVVVVRAEASDLPTAARAWVTLRWAGVRDVRVVADATAAELAAHALRATARPTEGDVAPRRDAIAEPFSIADGVTIDADGVAGRPADALLVDARPTAAFGDDASQHIPGAVSIPSALLVEDGSILPPDRVREAYEAHGRRVGAPVIAYCGSGVAASVQALALASIGVDAAVYVGSWSEWSRLHAVASAL